MPFAQYATLKFIYYQSPFGGRVFFDALGWPWPKHPCTDNADAGTKSIRMLALRSGPIAFRNKNNEILDIYKITDLYTLSNGFRIRFQRLLDHKVFWSRISKGLPIDNSLTIDNIQRAPSFIIKRNDPPKKDKLLQFISGRHKQIIILSIGKE